MKQIVYRGGVVTFRIPSHWREEYSDIEGGTFYEDRPESGTLRLRIITMRTAKELHSDSAKDILEMVVSGLKKNNVEGGIRGREDGIAVLKYEEAAHANGMRLTIFHWVIANSLPPHRARIITFSYTILAGQRNQKCLPGDLEMLEAEIESATFSSDLGIIPRSPYSSPSRIPA